jgi:hypothetical protein
MHPLSWQVVACTGLALCALHSLSLDKAAEHCASGLRAVRMTMATSQVRLLYQSMTATDNRVNILIMWFTCAKYVAKRKKIIFDESVLMLHLKTRSKFISRVRAKLF